MSSRSTFIGAVEIGTSKITALVGEYTGRELAIIGHGECSSRGVIKGAVVDYKAACECTHSALEQAERDGGERIEMVFLAQTGAHLEGFYNEAAVNVKAADNMIEAADIRTVSDLAKSKELPAGRMVVHNIRRPFRVDGRLVPGTPESLVGQRLEVGYWTVHGQEQRLADNIHVIRGFNLEVRELVLASLASGHMVTTAEDRQHGFILSKQQLQHLRPRTRIEILRTVLLVEKGKRLGQRLPRRSSKIKQPVGIVPVFKHVRENKDRQRQPQPRGRQARN